MIAKGFTKCSDRCEKIRTELVQAVPAIEVDRAYYLTQSYKETENEPHVIRRAKALEKVLLNLPVVIREGELVVGSLTKNPRSCQLYPEFSYEWVMAEFDTIATRLADQFTISEEDKKTFREILPYWKDKTVSDLALAYMSKETKDAMAQGVFTVGNYLFGGVGHVIIDYDSAIRLGYNELMKKVAYALETADKNDPDYIKKSHFWKAQLIVLNAGIQWAKKYADKAREMAASCADATRKAELLQIAKNCEKVPAQGATNFWEACQSFIFTQFILQCESSGHSVSPGRFDQYMYPFLEKDTISKEEAQELLDCVFLKLNDLNKVRDDISSQGFAGYQVFQNINAGGQTKDGVDATNPLSYMMIDTVARIRMNAPSFSVRIWNGTPDEFLFRCCELCRLGLGLPAMYNDECIIPALTNRGISLHDARDYGLIGCVEPEPQGLEYGWHDSAFFNAAKILELTINNGMNKGVQVGPKSGDVTTFTCMDQMYDAFKTQMDYFIYHVVQADNCVDLAHRERAQLPFLSCFVHDCTERGLDVNEGGARYNFTGPQYFGVGDVGDSMYSIKKHVFDQKDFTFAELKDALDHNFGEPVCSSIAPTVEVNRTSGNISGDQLEAVIQKVLGEILGSKTSNTRTYSPAISVDRYAQIRDIIERDTEWYGNDIDAVDEVTRKCAQIYCYEVEKYYNPRGGQFQAGIYPVSANVLFGKDVGALPDGRLATTPLGDGCSPRAGKDTKGPTAAANSVAKLDHEVASNGTLYNQKFLPSSVEGDQGLINFAGLVRSYFDKKGMHVQFNVIDKDTLLDAQAHPENYKDLVVRVAGYSAMFTALAKEVQDDIIHRTEHQL